MGIMMLLMISATLFLAFANGANDNFKGVATLYGSRTLSQRQALVWATITTMAGSLTAAWLATELMRLFSGKGLVPDILVGEPVFMLAVLSGSAMTVMLAARIGIPISTTHALVGALVGTGLAATSWNIHWDVLLRSYFWPLLASPLIALVLASALYRALSGTRKWLGINKETCVCIGSEKAVPMPGGVAALQTSMPELLLDSTEHCREIQRYQGRMVGLSYQGLVEGLHVLSGGAVSFARGLNDTPKIVGVALAASALNVGWLTFVVALAMGLGGVLSSHRIARTMSDGITDIQHGPGLAANLVTSFLVLVASKWGVPVSTTHVSCGSIFGIATSSGKTDWSQVQGIAGAWLATLPMAALLAAGVYLITK